MSIEAAEAPQSKRIHWLAGVMASNILKELRERIASEHYLTGTPLRETELAKELGVSRAQIREAFGGLEQLGLIVRIRNRGAIVAELNVREFFDLFDVREMLEGLAARMATHNAPPGHWDDLVKLYGRPMAKIVSQQDFDGYVKHLEKFRQRMITAANNPLLTHLVRSLQDRTAAMIRRIILLPGRAKQGLIEHRAVLAAMQTGDGEEAERLKRANIRSSREYLERYERFLLASRWETL